MATHQSGVILILCSGLALIRSTQSQLIRTANSCDDIICPGGNVQYDCSVPIGTVVVWRMMPECERNDEQPDITFFLGDPLMSIACNDGRKITVQGMETSNGTRFVSTLNVTNITSSQTTECLFDDETGSQDQTIGNNTVFTTAPAQGVEITALTPNVVLTLNQAINCPLIEYAVNSSTNCGMCGIVIDDTITCTNARMGSKCIVHVVVETELCGIPVNQTVMTFDVKQQPITLSTTPASTQEGSLSGDEITIAVVVPAIVILLAAAVIITVIAISVFAYKRMVKTYKSAVQETIQEQDEAEGRAEKVEMKPLLNSEAHNNQPGTEAGDNGQQNNGQGDLVQLIRHQTNEGESKHQNNDERDSGRQNNDEGDFGHQHDDERDSGHQYKDERDAVEQVNKDEDKGNQNSDEGGDTDQDTEATESGDKSNGNHPLQVDDGESSQNGSNPLTLVGFRDETPITQPDTYNGNRANIMISERHCAPTVTRSSEAKMFLSTAEESPEYNPPQKESEHYPSGDLQTITTTDPQIFSCLNKLIQGQADLMECIKKRDRQIDELQGKVDTLEEQMDGMKEDAKETKAELERCRNEIKQLKKEKRDWMKQCKKELQQKKDDKRKEVQKKLAELPLQEEAKREQINEELVQFQAKIDEKMENIDKELEKMEQEDGQL